MIGNFYRSNSPRFTIKNLIAVLPLLVGMFYTVNLRAQCDNTYSNPGNEVLSKDRLCAPNNFIWEVKYRVNKGVTVEYEVDWGDGVTERFTPSLGVDYGLRMEYIDTLVHNYTRLGNECNYLPTTYLVINGNRCTSSNQSQPVTVWDTDEENGGIPRITPDPVRVCWGTEATITFQDNSQWNCTPATGEDDNVNNQGRWVQWIYGTEGTASIPALQVDGTPEVANQSGNIDYLSGPIDAPNSTSLEIYVPATTTQADVGKTFQIALRNWNVCNPYDANIIDGNPMNPTTGDLIHGDSLAIITYATIVIVDKAVANYETRNDDGDITSEYCVDETIHLNNLTSVPGGALHSFEWTIYDDDLGTVPLTTSNDENPTVSFASSGIKRIDLKVTDTQSEGNCDGTVTKYVNIVSSAIANIQTKEINGQDTDQLCISPDNPLIQLEIADISANVDPVHSQWQWDFLHWNGTSYQLDSTKNGAGTQETFEQKITSPGSYLSILTSSADNVDCFTKDSSIVHIYAVPNIDFEADMACLGQGTLLTATATLPVVINNDFISLYEWDINEDGIFDYSSSSPTITHTFTSSGSHSITLKVSTDKGKCGTVITKDVEVKAVPMTAFTPDITEGCGPLEVTFVTSVPVADQPVTASGYIWHITDLLTGTETEHHLSPTNTFQPDAFENHASGNQNHQYEIWLEIEADNGCSAISSKKTITVYPSPIAQFSMTNPTTNEANCSPRNFIFEVDQATHDLSPDKYKWIIIEDNTNDTIAIEELDGSNRTFNYTLVNEGTAVKRFKVKLEAEKSNICFSSTQKLVSVSPVPSSIFQITPVENDCDFVILEVEAEQKGLMYEWEVFPLPINTPDFTEEKLELRYAKNSAGSYQVSIQLKTTNLILCESIVTTEQVEIYKKENLNPTFRIEPSILEIPNRTIEIIPETNNSTINYLWDFGDGTISTEANPGTHTYETFGEYWVKVTIQGVSCEATDSAQVMIRQTLPQIDFDYSSIVGCLPLTVYFDNDTQYADSTTFFWSFGDGNTSTELHPEHTYTSSGIYTVTLQASNELGIAVTKEKQLIVDLSSGPKAAFDIRLAKAYLPEQDISFSNQSINASLYFWDFGDGSTSSEVEPVHRYQKTGDYDITLIVQNELGCSDTVTQAIFIQPLVPEVDFSYAPPTGCRPLTVEFTNLSRFAEPGTYRWSFGEGEGISTEENPSYTYYEPGVYTITLEASNSIGVTAIKKKEFSVEVYPNPIAAFNLRPDKVFLGESVYLVNLSDGADQYLWNFGDGSISTEKDPVHVYQEPGTYDISLIVQNEHGCSDTLTKISAVLVETGGKIEIPNAFTPSSAGPGGVDIVQGAQNDIFLPVFEGVTSFHMMIFNRWGELLFESRQKGYGWDGYYKGKLCPKDVYIYRLELKFSDGRSETKVGDLTLIR